MSKINVISAELLWFTFVLWFTKVLLKCMSFSIVSWCNCCCEHCFKCIYWVTEQTETTYRSARHHFNKIHALNTLKFNCVYLATRFTNIYYVTLWTLIESMNVCKFLLVAKFWLFEKLMWRIFGGKKSILSIQNSFI